jgi:hypothetical protein
VVGSCEYGTEPSGSVKCCEIRERLAASQVGISSLELDLKVPGAA